MSRQLLTAAGTHVFWVPPSLYTLSSCLDLNMHFQQNHQEQSLEELWAKKHRAKERKPKFKCINSKKYNSTTAKKFNSINTTPSKVNLEETSRQGGTSTAVSAVKPLAEGRAAGLTSAEV